MSSLSGLYVITDEVLTPKSTMLRQVEEALLGGANIVQLRDKHGSDEEVSIYALELQRLCEKHGALFVLNDRVKLATALGVSGLHVGESDYFRVEEIREEFEGVLGISCYGDVKKAKEMEGLGVDYVAFGSCFSSPTKPSSNVIALDVISSAKESLSIPVCAIGGINSDNLDRLMAYRPDMVAVISDIWSAGDITSRSRLYARRF